MRWGTRGVGALLCAASGVCAAPAQEQVVCHLSYGGDTQLLRAAAVAEPQAVYQVAPVAIGSYFLFRIVFQRSPRAQASIKLYTYADRDEGPVLIHQVRYPYPPLRQGRGFTGEQWVYEPVRDGELQYWCALDTEAAR
jgi:hypothetical protein